MTFSTRSKIYVAGHTGLVGSAILRRLEADGFSNLVVRDITELDLTDSQATADFFQDEKPEFVFLAAAKVGGIHANDAFPADFIRINLQIQTNILHQAYYHDVEKLLFLGSSCIYPKLCPQPMREEHLLTGKLEPTNDAYAIAKIAGILMCKAYNRQHGTNFIAAMPTNLYGPGDNFDLQTAHVLPALIRKFHEAKEDVRRAACGVRRETGVELWGTGSPRREFLFVDDLAAGLLFLMEHFDAQADAPDDLFVNLGVGEDVTIRELAGLIQEIVGYQGEVTWDSSMPDGTPRKLLDVSRMEALGWKANTSLREGLEKTYAWYLESVRR